MYLIQPVCINQKSYGFGGCETTLMGKWYLNSLPGDGFGYYKVLTGAGNQGFYYNPEFNLNGKDTVTEKGYSTDIITEESAEWLQKLKERDNPFMLFGHYKAPHEPYVPFSSITSMN